jgi:hypothetical protein
MKEAVLQVGEPGLDGDPLADMAVMDGGADFDDDTRRILAKD